MSVALEAYALFLQKFPLPAPPRRRAPLFIHHPMARQFFRPWRARPLVACYRRDERIPQSPPHHPRVTWPSSQRSDMPVRRHPSTRNLPHDVQHILAKPPRLLRRHPIRIVFHTCLNIFDGANIVIISQIASKSKPN